jgi:hypothetical protein
MYKVASCEQADTRGARIAVPADDWEDMSWKPTRGAEMTGVPWILERIDTARDAKHEVHDRQDSGHIDESTPKHDGQSEDGNQIYNAI